MSNDPNEDYEASDLYARGEGELFDDHDDHKDDHNDDHGDANENQDKQLKQGLTKEQTMDQAVERKEPPRRDRPRRSASRGRKAPIRARTCGRCASPFGS